ncbi:MAG: polysaccharide deacetylase family protein [Streptosporangiaceae bacterium]
MTTPVPILMYHSVCREPGSVSPGFRPWTLHPARFAAHLTYLSQRGYRSLTVSELTATRRGGRAAPDGKAVVLTFDDAYGDFHTEALPLLRRYGFTATLYVPTAYVGATSGWMRAEGEGDRALLTWSQLEEVAAAGVECGAHSHTHPELDRLPIPAIREEVTTSRRALRDRLGVPVCSFAYPYGEYDGRVRGAVAAAGYESACTMKRFASTERDDPLLLPRVSMTADTDVPALAALLETSGRPARRHALNAKQRAWVAWRRLSRPAHRDDATAAAPRDR